MLPRGQRSTRAAGSRSVEVATANSRASFLAPRVLARLASRHLFLATKAAEPQNFRFGGHRPSQWPFQMGDAMESNLIASRIERGPDVTIQSPVRNSRGSDKRDPTARPGRWVKHALKGTFLMS
jgi:hypothetical protein